MNGAMVYLFGMLGKCFDECLQYREDAIIEAEKYDSEQEHSKISEEDKE